MKVVAQILLGVALLALMGILTAVGYSFVYYGINTKTIIAAFVALLALGGIIGRMIVVAKDTFDKK